MMHSSKAKILEACVYEELAMYSRVLNASTINQDVWIYLDPDVVRTSSFVEAHELGSDKQLAEFSRVAECWIKVDKSYFKDQISDHIIELDFTDNRIGIGYSLYVSYYMQNDNPEKPYIYMKDEPEPDPSPSSDDEAEQVNEDGL